MGTSVATLTARLRRLKFETWTLVLVVALTASIHSLTCDTKLHHVLGVEICVSETCFYVWGCDVLMSLESASPLGSTQLCYEATGHRHHGIHYTVSCEWFYLLKLMQLSPQVALLGHLHR